MRPSNRRPHSDSDAAGLRASGAQQPAANQKDLYCTDYFKLRLFNAWARQHRALLGEHAVLPVMQAIQEYELITGYTWQQRRPLKVACAP